MFKKCNVFKAYMRNSPKYIVNESVHKLLNDSFGYIERMYRGLVCDCTDNR